MIVIYFVSFSPKFIIRDDTKAIQAAHATPVARIGGLSIMMALVFAIINFSEIPLGGSNYSLMLISAFPVFIVGLCEDLGYFSSPRIRLLAAVFSGIVFVSLFERWLPGTDIPGLDFLIQWSPIGIGFSLFLAAGVNHAFNLIDGLNGLAGFTSIGVALSLAVISHQVELYEHRDALIILISAVSGFLLFNFPFGKIFLGDGGAYLIGHILVWIAISILYATPSITPLAMLLIFFFPVMDTLLAIARRVYLGTPISHPDRLHFHQLILCGVENLAMGRKWRQIINPLAAIITLPFALVPMIIGVLFAFDRIQAAIACFCFLIIFVMAYLIIMWLTHRLQRFTKFKETQRL